MLTIGQLATYAGVSIRAVRHYHHVGLLPEPERDHSGYRSYDAADVVRLIKIRTLAQAGVPLAKVKDLLEADEEAFDQATAEIDRDLRARIRTLQEHRRRIAGLRSGDSLALPPEVEDYLARLRALGAPEEALGPERDAWILMAARWPEQIPEMMADKVGQLEDPRMTRLYRLLATIVETGEQPPVLEEVADLIAELLEEAAARGDLDKQAVDTAHTRLMDSFAEEANPAVATLQAMLAERGWSGWTRIERADH